MSRARQLAVWMAIAGGIWAAAAVLRARDLRYPEPQATERLLYLRSGNVADRLMLTFDNLAADVYWIRAIQHYGRDLTAARPDPFGLLYPLLDLTTTLDPYFDIAYRFGAIFLSQDPPDGPGRPDLGIALLEKGLRTQPDQWRFALDIGYIHYMATGDFARAAEAFRQAAAMPGAAEWVGPLAAVTLARGGDRAGARQLFENLLESSSETYLQQAAQRGLAQLEAMDDIDDLQRLVDRYADRVGSPPASWADVPELQGGVPVDDTRVPFRYDATTGVVSLAPESTLGPLPRGLDRP